MDDFHLMFSAEIVLNHYVNANGWWTATVRRDWKKDVTDGPGIPVGTVLGTVTYGEWNPVAMWKIDGDDHTSTVPLIVEDGNKIVEMGSHVSDHRELFYIVQYSSQGMPPRRQTREILKE
jgi:hypothetical protein